MVYFGNLFIWFIQSGNEWGKKFHGAIPTYRIFYKVLICGDTAPWSKLVMMRVSKTHSNYPMFCNANLDGNFFTFQLIMLYGWTAKYHEWFIDWYRNMKSLVSLLSWFNSTPITAIVVFFLEGTVWIQITASILLSLFNAERNHRHIQTKVCFSDSSRFLPSANVPQTFSTIIQIMDPLMIIVIIVIVGSDSSHWIRWVSKVKIKTSAISFWVSCCLSPLNDGDCHQTFGRKHPSDSQGRFSMWFLSHRIHGLVVECSFCTR